MVEEYNIWIEINNHVYICHDVPDIDNQDFINLMNAQLLSFGKYGHNLCVHETVNEFNPHNQKAYLPELSAQKVREYLTQIETCQLMKNDNDTDSDEELYFNPVKYQKKPGFSEIVGIDGETIFTGQINFS
jgi:hypothetical protein